MALRISIQDLIQGNIVESQRIEYKEGWNPEPILHTICAFANDFQNIGGGYVVVGIAENNGQPVLPPAGIAADKLDKLQKDIVDVCHSLNPSYFPNIEIHSFQGKNIIIIQCLSGDVRPYSAPETLGKGSRRYKYIRVGSVTKRISNQEEERQLDEISRRVPFDDRANHTADLNYIDISLIQQYLSEVKSPLLNNASSKQDLLESMDLMCGPAENRQLRNIALMLFCPYADKVFNGLGIEIVEFKDNAGTEYTEKKFDGPVHVQLKEALTYFKNQIQKEIVIKLPNQATSKRSYNYPYQAFEEALVNAVYHMSYDQNQKVEVRIHPERIEILSWPGPMPPITQDTLKEESVTARRYRNRRLGDYLKELKLTEARATGIPTIRKALRENGSDDPKFETDAESTYFRTTLYLHEKFIGDAVKAAIVSEKMILTDLEQLILEHCQSPSTKPEIRSSVKKRSTNYNSQQIDQAIRDLDNKGMLVSKKTKIWFVAIGTVYTTNQLGRDALANSF